MKFSIKYVGSVEGLRGMLQSFATLIDNQVPTDHEVVFEYNAEVTTRPLPVTAEPEVSVENKYSLSCRYGAIDDYEADGINDPRSFLYGLSEQFVKQLLRECAYNAHRGKSKIQIIKFIRERTQKGLGDSKSFVEQHADLIFPHT